jgi:Uma2 family endonuclease
MTTPAAEALMTAEEFARLTDPPGVRTELIRGRVVELPPAKTDHSGIAIEIAFHLRTFVGTNRLGRVTGEGGYLLSRDPDTVRGPDAAFVAASRLPGGRLRRGQYFEGPPDLAVEVISPDDRESDVADKVSVWLDAGARRVWEVRPRTETVTIHTAGDPPRTLGAGDSLTSADAGFPVEGFALPVADIFA